MCSSQREVPRHGATGDDPESLPHAELSRKRLLTSNDNDCMVHCWTPKRKGPPRGLVVLIHGLGGHSMYPTTRYLAELLVDHNFCVYSGDFCGHGQSYGVRGYIESPDVLLEDANHVIEFARKSHPNLLLFLGGVSMGGAVAMMLSIELKSRISGMILMAPMVSMNVPKWQRLTLKNLHRVSKTMVLCLPTPNHSDLKFRDVDRRKEADEDPYTYKGRLRIATAITCIELSRRVHQQLQEITTPFLALMALEDYVVDNNAIDDLMELAQSTDKTLKEYEALHGLLCEEEPLRSEIERDIVHWLIERTLPGC